MSIIAKLTRTEDGFAGRLHTMSLDVELVLVPAGPSQSQKAPDFRIHLQSVEGPAIGAGWKREASNSGDQLVVVIDDPVLPQPIRAFLLRSTHDEDEHILVWSRPASKAAKE